MGRKSKLTEKQWAEAAERAGAGEPISSIAESYKIDQRNLRKGLTGFKVVAKDIADTIIKKAKNDEMLESLSSTKRKIVSGMVRTLISISENTASAAEHASNTARILHIVANREAKKVTLDKPTEGDSGRALISAARIIKVANMAAELPINLLKANNEAVRDINKVEQDEPEPKQIVFTVTDSRRAEP
jgi:hypothetical protein